LTKKSFPIKPMFHHNFASKKWVNSPNAKATQDKVPQKFR